MAGVGLAEVLGVIGEQADEEVDAAEVAVAQSGQPRPHFRFDLNLAQPSYAFNAICILCYSQAVQSGAGGM